MLLGPGGVIYGTAVGGQPTENCSTGCGAAFQLTPPSTEGGQWTETILRAFTGGTADGSQPNSTPVLGPHGELYGTTLTGGIHGWGTIFELVPPSSPEGEWTEVILHAFSGGPDGGEPNSLVLGADGNLYGTTQVGGISAGGVHNQGTVFQLVLH